MRPPNFYQSYLSPEWHKDIENNADFYSHDNQAFYVKVLKEFNHKTEKPIVFLPCASQKPISKSVTHGFLKAITKNENFEKIIISEPQTVIPYALEKHCPDYDYPPGNLTIRDRWQLVRRLGIFLGFLKDKEPKRKRIYYIGSKHHCFILQDALLNVSYCFNLIYTIPAYGIRDYAKYAKEFSLIIKKIEDI
ncbi:MAG: hypothetical protein GF353_28680 [Candidatus Lokiarchaeota archaeon]|nr:hypothetical protein [Candidatus Lokiarchaeota archaeon]MBD3353978.1 hypothetical protein [Candidatus Lokiarchaeota archaeon]